MTYHVLIPDRVDPAAVELLREAGGIEVTAPGRMSREETLAAIGTVAGLIIRSTTQADAELIGMAPRLKAIVRAGAGVDNVDLPAATARGVVVMNTPEGNTVSTAEHTFALMLALARHIPAAHQALAEGRWERKAFEGVELKGKTLGIVGLGRVGRAVAERALAFGMTVIAYMPYSAADPEIEAVGLDVLLARSDFISLHPRLTDETRGMIDAAAIAKMKPGVRIVNAARGAIVDAHALADALRSGHVAGAAVDVYSQEPPSPDYPLVGLPNVVHTPHLAASTADAQIAVAVLAAEQMAGALLRGEYRNVTNPEALPASSG